jgi:DNA-binding CsgD family transcriptional regulator
MALTGIDEAELLLPLMSAPQVAEPFAAFLKRLRRRTSCISASIVIRIGETQTPLDFVVGPPIRHALEEAYDAPSVILNRVQYDRLRPGRVYGIDEFDDHDLPLKAVRLRTMRKLGLADARMVRLLAEPDLSAWLNIASASSCTAAASALLSSLTPYVAAAVRSFVDGERRRMAQALDSRTLEQAGCGWIVFDKAACVLAIAPATANLLALKLGHPPKLGERLRELGTTIDRTLIEAAGAFDLQPDRPDRSITLMNEPRIQAILAPAPTHTAGLLHKAAMVATCRQVRAMSVRRAEHFAKLYDLPQREAELAILLADGLSLTEASQALALTIETTRNYSKRLFAKLHARGQAELVRAVYESCVVLA